MMLDSDRTSTFEAAAEAQRRLSVVTNEIVRQARSVVEDRRRRKPTLLDRLFGARCNDKLLCELAGLLEAQAREKAGMAHACMILVKMTDVL